MDNFNRFVLSLVGSVVLAGTAATQGDPALVARLIEEGKGHNQAYGLIRELTQKIGPRLTGSPKCHQAEQWALRKFQRWELSGGRIEKYGEFPVGFERGRRQSGKMLGSEPRALTFTTPNWTIGTKGRRRGPAIKAPETPEALEAIKPKLKGAWVLMPEPIGMRGLRKPDDPLDDAGIAGRVFSSGSQYVHGFGTWRTFEGDNAPKSPLVAVTKDDFQAISDRVAKGEDVQLEFDIDNRFVKGPAALNNVMADIPGTEKPDEYVILVAHLDSWNAPGSQGACDNGTGSTAVMEAARLLKKVGAKPKRTIRFLLVTGEEQGLLGSLGYVRDHASELDKVSAVLCEDSGPLWHAGLSAGPEQVADLKLAAAPMADAFPGMPVTVREVARARYGGGSDHASFGMKGVPAFFMIKGGSYPYTRIWHTQLDRFEEVSEENLKQMSTNLAVIAYNLACSDHLLARPSRGGE